MFKFKRLFSSLLTGALIFSLSVTAFASNTIPYKDSIVYDENGQVDSKYYENMQKKYIMEFEKSVSTPAVSAYARSAHPTIPGDVYVSFSGTSSGVDFALVGHASIVETAGGTWCISSWPDRNGVNGVQYEYNYWTNKNNIYGLRVKDGTDTSRAAAVENAKEYVSARPRIPYNGFFLNKFTTSSFYCSQLVWRCWYDAGIDIDRNPFDTVVSPAELTGSKMKTILYVNN